jgi:hypothetical protein
MPFLCPNGMTGSISLAKKIFAYSREQPLDSQAWALQEYLLSPRLLMYGASELTWHCQTQGFQSIGKSHLRYWSLAQRLPPQIFDCGDPRLMSGPRQRHELWASIAMDYSGRLLTFSEDKLSAIAGVANELSEAWKDTYLYGTWQGNLATLETTVAASLVTLSTSVDTGRVMPLPEAARRETILVKLNCRINVNELTAISRRM